MNTSYIGASVQRDATLDIAKGICISLMVIGHATPPSLLWGFIYAFHMPCFFFITGWLLSDKYIDNIKLGLKSKFKSLYIPFIQWFGLFTLLHNLFVKLHIYTPPSYTLTETFFRVLNVFRMHGTAQMVGGFWFLRSLLIISVIAIPLLHWIHRITTNVQQRCAWAVGIIILLLGVLLGGPYELYLPFPKPSFIGVYLCTAGAMFLTGYVSKRIINFNQFTSRQLLLSTISFFIFPIVSSILFHIELYEAVGLLGVIYFAASLSGTYGILFLSKYLAITSLKAPLVYIGQKTLWVLGLHFLSFKLVSSIYLEFTNQPITLLTKFPTLRIVPSWMWLVYSFIGIVTPLLFFELKTFVWKYIKLIVSN